MKPGHLMPPPVPPELLAADPCPCCGRRRDAGTREMDEITLEGEVHDLPGTAGIDPWTTGKLLALCCAPRLLLHLNCVGGSAGGGFETYRLLRDHRRRVAVLGLTIVVRTALSAGTIILCAGDRVLVREDTRILIHPPRGTVPDGTAEMMLSAARRLRVAERRLRRLLRTRTGGGDFTAMLRAGEHRIDAHAAVALRLADGLAPQDPKPTPRPLEQGAMVVTLDAPGD